MMASGPHVLSGNRFSGLEIDPLPEPINKKRKKPNYKNIDHNSIISTYSTCGNPKFIVIASSNVDKPLSSFSVFLLKKAIDGICIGYEYITQLRDGNLLILVKSKKVSNLCLIKVFLHTNLNSSKGTYIYAPYLLNVPNDEIVNEMKKLQVFKFKKEH